MSAEALVEQIINDAISRANEAQDKATSYGDAAQTAAIGTISLTTPTVATPTIPDPPFPPDINATNEFSDTFDEAFAGLSADFATQWQNFINTFFPEIDGCIAENVDEWICNTIENGGTGIPPAVEDAIFTRGQSRELKMMAMKQDDIVDQWASRGFELPSGVVQNQLDAVYDETSDKLSSLSRDVLIKNKEIEIENIRFAVGQGVQLRIGALNAAVNYVRAWMLIPQTAVEKARALATTRLTFYQAIAAYYNALASKHQVLVEYAKANMLGAVETNKAVASYSSAAIVARVNAAVGSAEALGRVASAAFGANNTLSNIGNVTLNTKKAA